MHKIVLLALLLNGFFAGAQKKSNPEVFAKAITGADLKKHLTIIASREMEGRETATPGQKRAAAYIEQQFKNIGLVPGNNGSYQMYYTVYQDSITKAVLEINGKSFSVDKDFAFNINNVLPATYHFSEVVAINNMSDTAKISPDMRGKIVLLFENNLASAATTNSKLQAALNTASVVLNVSTNKQVFDRNNSKRRNMYLHQFVKSVSRQNFFITPQVAAAITGTPNLPEQNGKIYSADILLSVEKQTILLQSSNVIGYLPGTDLKDEYVFLTGHYDHLGKRDTVIWYGADDDGSGTVGVIEMAQAFAKAKAAGKGPRRTIVFMTVSGEEKGLWGSEYYSDHPLFPLDKTSVDLNTDMVGRIDTERKTGDTTNYIYVIGHDKLSSDLPVINEAANNKYTHLKLDYKYDDPADKQRIYFRSDHYNFARKGVPILFFYDGMLLADYHKPTDTIEKINWDLYEKRVRLIFLTAWEIANRDKMLKRDIPLQAL
ncbi:MAG: M28 family peptidase [Chitinophagaceae bacterium]|nr:M28 family peptidase [Chitinophagaceae bacterium]